MVWSEPHSQGSSWWGPYLQSQPEMKTRQAAERQVHIHRRKGNEAKVHGRGDVPAFPLAKQGRAEAKVAEDAEDGQDYRDRDLMKGNDNAIA